MKKPKCKRCNHIFDSHKIVGKFVECTKCDCRYKKPGRQAK